MIGVEGLERRPLRNGGTASVAIFAAAQADKRAEAGDLEGKAVWVRVIRVIEELLNTEPPPSARALN